MDSTPTCYELQTNSGSQTLVTGTRTQLTIDGIGAPTTTGMFELERWNAGTNRITAPVLNEQLSLRLTATVAPLNIVQPLAGVFRIYFEYDVGSTPGVNVFAPFTWDYISYLSAFAGMKQSTTQAAFVTSDWQANGCAIYATLQCAVPTAQCTLSNSSLLIGKV